MARLTFDLQVSVVAAKATMRPDAYLAATLREIAASIEAGTLQQEHLLNLYVNATVDASYSTRFDSADTTRHTAPGAESSALTRGPAIRQTVTEWCCQHRERCAAAGACVRTPGPALKGVISGLTKVLDPEPSPHNYGSATEFRQAITAWRDRQKPKPWLAELKKDLATDRDAWSGCYLGRECQKCPGTVACIRR